MGNQTEVIMPVLGMSQEYGTIVRWLKLPGDRVEKGEPLMEVETDKTIVEIEAPATGYLSHVTAQEGDEIPVTQVVAIIQDAEPQPTDHEKTSTPSSSPQVIPPAPDDHEPITMSPLAARIAAEHKLDLSQIKPLGGRIEKADVLAYLQNISDTQNLTPEKPKRTLASPKARRIADEHGIDIRQLTGSGPQGAVISDDVLSHIDVQATQAEVLPSSQLETAMSLSTTWNRMVERISGSWPATPHFYLMKEVNASRLISWRESIQGKTDEKITFTDLLVKLTAAALKQHPRINSHFKDGSLMLSQEINIGLAVAIDDGLVVPVIHRADSLTINQIAQRRIELVKRAQSGRLDLKDLQTGTFTISNLGMYGIDAFNAVLNPPQSAILAVGQIADRVIPLNGQPAIQPMMVLSVSFDHRAVDGARGAQFLKTLADLIREPLGLVD